MCFRLTLIHCLLLYIFLLLSTGCFGPEQQVYRNHPYMFHKQIRMVCLNTDASHFVVKDQKVWFSLQDGQELEMKHYQPQLPDDYYFCSGQVRTSTILD